MQELVLKLAGSFGHKTAGEIAVVLSLLLFVLFKGLYSLNLDRAKARQEFLQLWDFERAKQDPLWCEVLVRHYCRQFLPAKLVVNVASNSQAADTLWALSESAQFFHLDDGFVRWKNRRYTSTPAVVRGTIFSVLLYFLLMVPALLLLFVSYRVWGTTSGYLIFWMVLAGLLFGGFGIRALNHGLDLGRARKNFLSIQRMQPSLVPQPLGDGKDPIENGRFSVRPKRKALRRGKR